MKTTHKITTAIMALSLAAISCSERYPGETAIRSRYKNARQLNDTAAFLAGMDVRAGSRLLPLTRQDEYRKYREQINQLWNEYKKLDLDNIASWRRNRVPSAASATLMYPFSGPDILNALAFFPGAERYIMIGLEPPGNVPDPLSLQGPALTAQLWKVKTALRTILQLNLFRTIEMMSDLKPDYFSSITGIMMFFLARSGYEILDIHQVYIDRKGEVKSGTPLPAESEAGGVEFTFRKKIGAPLQTARFFSVDLSDGSLSMRRGFAGFLNGHRDFITFIKSASYLLSYDNFQILRNYLLANSRYVVQEDSGIPYKYFPETDWTFSFYGTYRVIAQFANRFQRDLDPVMKKRSAGPLPFSFGYGFVPEKSNIMIAKRIVKKKAQPVQ